MKTLFTQSFVSARFLAFSLLSVSLMFADHHLREGEIIRSGLTAAIYPLQWLINLPVAAGDWMKEGMMTRQTLLEENASLKAQHLLLQAKVQKLVALEAENARLRELLDASYRLQVGERMLIAELLAVATDPYRHQVVIDKGTRHGTFIGQPVLDAYGVMGQVIHTNPFTSTVLLVTDADHALPVEINRNGLRGIAVGTNDARTLELIHLPNNADIRVGDRIMTSGLGQHFPKGYPVGVVVDITRDPRQPFAKVKIQASAHLNRSREVLLVWPSKTPRE
ncbi:MAG: rod shape-determining protein MreC [Gammaproteobacteria bacterium]|nr:MAG: rod shape-determining protein MreC [Gammaproteobacteria bacterium]